MKKGKGHFLSVTPRLILDKRPKIVCLCGSTRFKRQFEFANLQETFARNIVLSVGAFAHADQIDISPEQKERLDELHLRKIDLADEILVIDPAGYIGESVSREIDYAKEHGKPIRYYSQEYAK